MGLCRVGSATPHNPFRSSLRLGLRSPGSAMPCGVGACRFFCLQHSSPNLPGRTPHSLLGSKVTTSGKPFLPEHPHLPQPTQESNFLVYFLKSTHTWLSEMIPSACLFLPVFMVTRLEYEPRERRRHPRVRRTAGVPVCRMKEDAEPVSLRTPSPEGSKTDKRST